MSDIKVLVFLLKFLPTAQAECFWNNWISFSVKNYVEIFCKSTGTSRIFFKIRRWQTQGFLENCAGTIFEDTFVNTSFWCFLWFSFFLPILSQKNFLLHLASVFVLCVNDQELPKNLIALQLERWYSGWKIKNGIKTCDFKVCCCFFVHFPETLSKRKKKISVLFLSPRLDVTDFIRKHLDLLQQLKEHHSLKAQ